MAQSTQAVLGPVQSSVRPRAWLCELMMQDGTTRTQIVEQDPNGLRWNDAGEPSPYRVTPLYGPEAMAAERERWAERVRSMCAADVRSGPGFYGEDDWIEAYKDLANMAGVACGYL